MDTTEKVLTNLIDSMHKHMATGHGKKKIDASKELQKAATKADTKDEPLTEREETFFDKFLKSSVRPKNKRKVEVAMVRQSPEKFVAAKKRK